MPLSEEDRGAMELEHLRKVHRTQEPPEDVRLLPPIPDGLKTAYSRLLASTCAPHTKLGVRYVLAGYSFVAAAKMVGAKNRKNIYDAARRHGCLGDFNRLISVATAAARLGLERLEEVLLDDQLEISARDLAVVTGVMIDKATAFEKLQRMGIGTDGPTFADALERLCAHVAETGGSVRASFEMSAGDSSIDVTPKVQGSVHAPLPLLETTHFAREEEALVLEVKPLTLEEEEDETPQWIEPKVPAPSREALRQLIQKHRIVLRMRNGWDGKGERTLEQVGRTLGTSRQRAHQLERKATERLREILNVLDAKPAGGEALAMASRGPASLGESDGDGLGAGGDAAAG